MGGTFFRSKGQGALNDITINVTVTNTYTSSTTIIDDIHCEVSKAGVVIETYDVQQTGNYESTTVGDPPTTTYAWNYNSSGFMNLRTAINSNVDSIIEMPARAYDIEDVAGVDPDIMTSFSGSFAGGVGGPTDGASVDTIRTGPTVTLIIIKSTENDIGDSVTPPASKRIQMWDGSQWTTFTPSPT